MKVRILGNSIRFRLKQPEVKQFEHEGEVKEVTAFGPAEEDKLSFILKTTPTADFLISFTSNTIVIQVPHATGTEWTNTELVGFEATINTGKGAVIKILVEKDFKCLDRNDIEDEDAYPNPNVIC